MDIRLNDLLFALSRGLDFVETELLGVQSNHGKRVAYMSARMCMALGLTDPEVADMACCAVLHDNALTAYMNNVGRGSACTLENFKIHCELGEDNIKGFPFVTDTSGIVLYHHENWDGSGFHALREDAIPLRASVLRLADNMDLRLRMEEAAPQMERIRKHAMRFRGSIYAPTCVDALLDVVDQDFVDSLRDDAILNSLQNLVAPVRMDVSTAQMLSVCHVFATIVDAKSPFTRYHTTGVAECAARFADSYNFDREHKDKLAIAAYLHDIGKLSTPPEILEKNGKLDPAEWEVMQNHVAMTEEILREIDGLGPIAAWASQHHEKLDGKGYPHGLAPEELSFESRLITCSDIYQALTETRPYRTGMPHEKAMGILDGMTARGEVDPDITERAREIFAAPAL